MKIIYDFGANNGLNLDYFLKKADKVVAIEANPSLVEKIKNTFNKEIKDGLLFVEQCVASDNFGKTDFYIHNLHDVLSTMIRPKEDEIKYYQKVLLNQKPASEIIKKHGNPFYIKIDIEEADGIILKNIFASRIYPEFISAECHNIDVFCHMVASGQYSMFNLINGGSVKNDYGFAYHSSGPFGDDIKDKWMNANDFFEKLAENGLGWKDIHAKK
jgi:hypothetical protein